MRLRQHFYTAGGWMYPLQQIVEREASVYRYDQFAVQDKGFSFYFLQCLDNFRKVASETAAGFGLQFNFFPIAGRDAPKSIPFGFILPLLAFRQIAYLLRLQRF